MPRLFLPVFLLLVLGTALPVPAQDLQQALEQSREQAGKRQETLQELKQQEESLSRDLRRVESEVRHLEQVVLQQQQALDALSDREEELRAEYFRLEARREAIGKDLVRLVRGIWPVHMRNLHNRFSGVTSWEQADRRFEWLAAVYRQVLEVLRQAAQAALERAGNLHRQQQLSLEAAQRLDELNSSKDELLRKRLKLRSGLRSVEGQRRSLEEELRSILATIKELDYRLKSQKTKRFGENKGFLPWPVQGRVEQKFAPNATPPHRGIGLRTEASAVIRSVFWGKVVHNDVLRGFGRVVIIYHGHDYYSLYAYLGESHVKVGQEVEKDEPVGLAGIYPEVQGPGLYFELRFGQKPINPVVWLFPQ